MGRRTIPAIATISIFLGNQDDLVKAILATGKPVVVFLIHGRPNSINYIAENVPAILDGWYLGQEGGTAAADVIFGDYNPGGKLPITVPRSVGQLPDYYYQKPTAKREYLGSTTLPLFPFGWGLSYSTFKYPNVRTAPALIGPEGETKVSVDVTNTGKVAAKKLCSFTFVTRSARSRAGERVARFPSHRSRSRRNQNGGTSLGFDELSFLNREMHKVVEPGSFKIMVGGNSQDLIDTTLNVAREMTCSLTSFTDVREDWHVGEGKKLVPIEVSHCVLSGADVISDRMHDRLVERRHLVVPRS